MLPFLSRKPSSFKSESRSVSPSPLLRRERPRERAGDQIFRSILLGCGVAVIAIAVGIAIELMVNSRLAWKRFGLGFLWGSVWDPVLENFGALPFAYGTLVTSAIALLIAVPLGVGSAVFLAELVPRRISNAITFLIELLAAIPSVVLGLIGIFVLVPMMRSAIQPFLIQTLGFIPFFDGYPYGIGMLTAGVILAIMILPYITSISRDVILSVPEFLKEAAYGLGATRWEMVKLVIFPFSKSGILGAVFLAMGRALGETMAVTMVIGNTPQIKASLMEAGYSMAALIANEFTEAISDLHVGSLVAIGLVLFVITIVVNGLARYMIYRMEARGRPA